MFISVSHQSYRLTLKKQRVYISFTQVLPPYLAETTCLYQFHTSLTALPSRNNVFISVSHQSYRLTLKKQRVYISFTPVLPPYPEETTCLYQFHTSLTALPSRNNVFISVSHQSYRLTLKKQRVYISFTQVLPPYLAETTCLYQFHTSLTALPSRNNVFISVSHQSYRLT